MSRPIELIDLPPVWLVACIAAAWGLAAYVPVLQVSVPAQSVAGWVLIGAGAALMLYAIAAFWRFKTSVIPRQTPSALIDTGPYRLSRNPIYLADLLVLVGIVLLLGALSAWITVPLFWAAIQYRFILPEEAVLRETFGAPYEAYCRSVRRWL